MENLIEYFKAHFAASPKSNSAIEQAMELFTDVIELTKFDSPEFDMSELKDAFQAAHAEWLTEYVEEYLDAAEIGDTLFIEVIQAVGLNGCTGVRVVNLGSGDCVYRYETDSHDAEWTQGDYEAAADEAWINYEESFAAP